MNKLLKDNLIGLALQVVTQADLSYLPRDLVVADRWLGPERTAQCSYGLTLELGVDVKYSDCVWLFVIVELQALFRVGANLVGEKKALFEESHKII